MNTEELIRGYFNKLLDKEQEEEYLTKYKNDEEFKLFADQLEIEILGIREAGRQELKHKFSNWEAQEKSTNNNNQNTTFFNIIKIGIAAILVIAVGLYFYYPTSPEDLFVAHYEPYQNYEYTSTRDEITDSASTKHLAYSNYDTGNFHIALDNFSKLIALNPKNMPAFFFRAMCKIELNNYAEAINDFKVVISSNNEYYADASLWYMALINIKLDSKDDSKILLKKLSSKAGDYQKKAQKLLEEL